MKKMNENQLQNLEAGKFWGWSCGPAYSIEPGSCYQNCTHHIFWFTDVVEYAVPCGVH